MLPFSSSIIDWKGAKLSALQFDTRFTTSYDTYIGFDATQYTTFSYTISRNTDQGSSHYFYLYVSTSSSISDKIAEQRINAGGGQGEYSGSVDLSAYSGKIYLIFVEDSTTLGWVPHIRDFSLS